MQSEKMGPGGAKMEWRRERAAGEREGIRRLPWRAGMKVGAGRGRILRPRGGSEWRPASEEASRLFLEGNVRKPGRAPSSRSVSTIAFQARRSRHGLGAKERGRHAWAVWPQGRQEPRRAEVPRQNQRHDCLQGKVPGRAERSAGADCTRRPGAKAGSAPGAQRCATSCSGKASVR